MRHIFAARPIATRPIGMREPPPTAGLIAPPGSTLRAQGYDSARRPMTPWKHIHTSQDAAAMNASRNGSAVRASRKRQIGKRRRGGRAKRECRRPACLRAAFVCDNTTA
jgi:hypothetical protein